MDSIKNIISNNDTYVSSLYPYMNFYSTTNLLVGYKSVNDRYYMLIKFDLSSIEDFSKVKCAKLRLKIQDKNFINTDKNVLYVYQLTDNFYGNSITYNTLKYDTVMPIGKGIVYYDSQSLDINLTCNIKCMNKDNASNYGLIVISDDKYAGTVNFFNSRSYIMSEVPKLILNLEGEIDMVITGRRTETIEYLNLPATNLTKYSNEEDVSQYDKYTYFVKNKGSDNCEIVLQISIDGLEWIDDSIMFTISQGETITIIPMIYSKYARIAYRAIDSNASLDIRLQCQV